MAATTSSYASQCVDDFVPKDTDIVFLEYALNDWEVVDSTKVKWMDNYQRYACPNRSVNIDGVPFPAGQTALC